jgi:hypothetical protein
LVHSINVLQHAVCMSYVGKKTRWTYWTQYTLIVLALA